MVRSDFLLLPFLFCQIMMEEAALLHATLHVSSASFLSPCTTVNETSHTCVTDRLKWWTDTAPTAIMSYNYYSSTLAACNGYASLIIFGDGINSLY